MNSCVLLMIKVSNIKFLERPIRDYELISDVSSSWNTDKMVNVFMIKRTSLAPFLHVRRRSLRISFFNS